MSINLINAGDRSSNGGVAFAFAAGTEGESAEDGIVGGFDCGLFAFENDGGAGLRTGSFAQNDESAAGAVGGLAEAEPCGQRNATGMLGGFIGEVEDDGCESPGLEEEIGSAKCLIESGPGTSWGRA